MIWLTLSPPVLHVRTDFAPPAMHIGPMHIATRIFVLDQLFWWGMGWFNNWLPGTERKELKVPNVPYQEAPLQS